VTWGGQPAVEGVVGEPVAGGKIMVHHLIVPTGEKVEAGKGPRALVVTFLAVEDAYHQFLAEACAAVGVTR
jgi:hypothetical protein